MLAQILRDMYVDPEILAELDEEQKQILFIRMREEQVHRWKEREDEMDRQEKLNPMSKPKLRGNAKSVNYLIAKDGNPWVWVLGEHEDEKSFSKILEAYELVTVQALVNGDRKKFQPGIFECPKMEKRDDKEDEERAKELARKEAEEQLKKKQAEEEAERERELKELKEKEEKVAQEKAKLEAEMKKLQEEAQIAAKQAEDDKRRLEEKRREEEKKRQEAHRREELRKKAEEKRREEERKKIEQQLAHQKAEEAWKRAKEKAAEEVRLQKLEDEKKRREAEEKIQEEQRRRQEELIRLKAAEEARIKREQEAKLRAKKLEDEKRRLEEEQKEVTRKRNEELERLRAQRKAEKVRREEELLEQERARAKEIYMSLKQVREEVKKKEMAARQKEEDAWKARERVAKQHEKERRSSVSLARREVKRDREMAKRSSVVPGNNNKAVAPPLPHRPSQSKPQRPPPPVPTRSFDGSADLRDRYKLGSPVITAPPVRTPERPPRVTKPKSRQAVIEWFRNDELPKNICYQDGKILPYFHGIICRQDAEDLLLKKPLGSFLVRVSERVWGYTITYRAANRCKHYLVDTSDNTYQFFGHNQIAHTSLSELIQFHKIRPISGMGQELLILPCGQSNDPPDYQELINPEASSGDTYSTKF